MRALRSAALLTAVAVALGVVAVQSGNAGATEHTATASSQSAPAAATVHIMRAPTVTSTIVARAAHVVGATTRFRGTTTTSTRHGRRVVIVRVVSTSTARATATVTDGEVSGTEVRLSSVARSMSASVVIKGSRRAATRAASRAAAGLALVASRSVADKAAKAAAAATAVGAATETYRRRRNAAPSPSPSPSATETSAPTGTPQSAAPSSSTPAPAPTDPSATPAPTTAAPSPTPTPTVTVSPDAMPTGNLPGWTQIFADDFTTPAPLGSFLSSYGSSWGAYPSPWKDTSGNGVYSPGKTMSAAGGMLDLWVHTESGVHYVAAPQPKLPTMTYGRFSARFQADSTPGYKVAWLLWPDSGVWPAGGEVDFPEGDLNSNLSAFAHFASPGGGQDAFTLPTTFAGWHTATIEWTPGKLVFLLDGKVVGTSTTLVPSKPMHWVMQTETTLNGSVPSNAASGHVRVDWVTAYTYTP
jgi:hypothetical protein